MPVTLMLSERTKAALFLLAASSANDMPREIKFAFLLLFRYDFTGKAIMVDVDLTQKEIQRLIAMDKYPAVANDTKYVFPPANKLLEIPLVSADKRENFIINFRHKNVMSLERRNHLIRAKKTVPLVRLDIDGPPHRNPDGQELGGTHLHIYDAEKGDRWAIPVPAEFFSNLSDFLTTLEDFMRYCNVKKIPPIDRDLLSCL